MSMRILNFVWKFKEKMRKLFFYISLLFSPLAAFAQSETNSVTFIGVDKMKAEVLPQESTDSTLLTPDSQLSSPDSQLSAFKSSLSTLSLYRWGKPNLFSLWSPSYPFGWGAGMWDLHEGLNGEIGAGVTVGWGKNNPFKGASFFTDVSLMYVKPISDKWTVAIGGTVSRFRFFNENQVMGSVTAMANYQFNEHLSATIFGAYHDNFSGTNTFNCFSPFLERCAEVGANFSYKFNNDVTVGIGFSEYIPVNTNNVRPWLPAPRHTGRFIPTYGNNP